MKAFRIKQLETAASASRKMRDLAADAKARVNNWDCSGACLQLAHAIVEATVVDKSLLAAVTDAESEIDSMIAKKEYVASQLFVVYGVTDKGVSYLAGVFDDDKKALAFARVTKDCIKHAWPITLNKAVDRARI